MKHYFTLLIAIFTMPAFAQQKANLQAVDHIGINVPDLPQALQFFTEVLGFTPVTNIGPLPLDSTWKKANHMHSGTGPVTIKMTRAGDGANLELFYYDKNEGSLQQPGSDDIGATHVAFDTPDIKESVAYLKSKGVTFLGEPFTTPAGDTEGETWVYFLAPWGAKMELVTYPNGKAYEKNHPAVLLWSPKKATATLSNEQLQKLAGAQMQLFNERNTTSRQQQMEQLYTADIFFADHNTTIYNAKDLNTYIGSLQQHFPGFYFTSVSVDAILNTVRIYWNYGDKAHPAAVKGMDLIVAESGKIKSLQVFLDTPVPANK